MSSPSIPLVKQAVIGVSYVSAAAIASRALQLESTVEIQSFLKKSSLELGIVS
jgi:phosphoenolpyruvate-protein kinase (PTS system EI component)